MTTLGRRLVLLGVAGDECAKVIAGQKCYGRSYFVGSADAADRYAAAVFLMHLGQAHFRVVGVHL
jgi:hypothetical protein